MSMWMFICRQPHWKASDSLIAAEETLDAGFNLGSVLGGPFPPMVRLTSGGGAKLEGHALFVLLVTAMPLACCCR